LAIEQVSATHPTDVRIYLTDHAAITGLMGWRPARDVRQIFVDLHDWMVADEPRLKPILSR
jgi:hypothetical protein